MIDTFLYAMHVEYVPLKSQQTSLTKASKFSVGHCTNKKNIDPWESLWNDSTLGPMRKFIVLKYLLVISFK